MQRRNHRPQRIVTRARAAPCGRERRARAVLALAVLAAALLSAACAPVVEPARAVVVDDGRIGVRAGSAVRAVLTFGFGDFDLQPGDLEPLPFPEIVSVPREDVTPSFVLRDVDAPAGWSVELDEVERVVESLGDAGRAYRLDVVLRVTAPLDAERGAYRVAATLRATGEGERRIHLVVVVPPPDDRDAALKSRAGPG